MFIQIKKEKVLTVLAFCFIVCRKTMPYKLQISKTVLMRWLSSEIRNQRIALVDLEPDLIDNGDLHLDFNVIFQPIRIERRLIGEYAQYFIGCTAAIIEVEATNGKIEKYTTEHKLDVNYQNSRTRKRNSNFKIAPELQFKSNGSETKMKVVEFGFEAGSESTFSANYTGKERILTAQDMGDAIRWEVVMPRGERVVSDFFSGNLYLFADCSWKSFPARGKFFAKASRVAFFDQNRSPFGKARSLMMEFILYKKGISIKEGTNVDFDFTFKMDD